MGVVQVTRINFSSILKWSVNRILKSSRLRPLEGNEIALLRCFFYSVHNELPMNYSNVSLRKCLLMYLND